MPHPVHREVHFWSDQLREPPCGTLEDRFDWSDEIEDVTCEECLQALAGDSGDLASPPGARRELGEDHHAPA